ncbi:MAG: DUF1446 domain-containing protein [Desulfurococcales archaeon]|nr:DUF1446 domain-containing protein [Desulfurococcales archaeon]
MELRILSPTAILGYGFPLESFRRGLRDGPDAIAVDAGSTDPGPYYLGEGVPFVSAEAVERDLYHLLEASLDHGIPLLVGSAGGGGARPHVEWALERLRRAASRLGRRVRVGLVYSDVDKDLLAGRLRNGLYSVRDPYSPLPELGEELVLSSSRIVAQVGVEPFIELLKRGVDVVLAGRSVDVAPFAALPWMKGFDRGLAVHMAKILECGALAAEPGSGSDGMMGVIRSGEFEVYPLNPARRATVTSVSEHALYERRDPYREYIPGGYADLTETTYEELGDGRVVVRGSRWISSERRLVKLEGVRLVGHRYVVIAGVRDPGFLERLDELVNAALSHVSRLVGGDGYRVYVRVYGRDGVMGPREPTPRLGHEAGLVIEVVAASRDRAKTVAGLVRSTLLHMGWEGRKTTAGNLAFPFSPSDLDGGRVYEWSIWHLVEERDPLEYARLEVLEAG